MQDSKLNRQELVHMAVRKLTCQHCICNSSSIVGSTNISVFLPPSCLQSAVTGANTTVTYLLKVWLELAVEDANGLCWNSLDLPTFHSTNANASHHVGCTVTLAWTQSEAAYTQTETCSNVATTGQEVSTVLTHGRYQVNN